MPLIVVKRLLSFALALSLFACSDDKAKDSATIENPKNQIQEYSYELNGVTINDPYAWIESNNDQKVQAWIVEQTELTNSYFSQGTFQDLFDEKSKVKPVNSYHWAQEYAYFYYFAYQTYIANASQWHLARLNTITKDLETYDLFLTTEQTATGYQLSLDGRFIAVLVKSSDSEFQWKIYDTINKSYFERKLPTLSKQTKFQWLNSQSFIYSNGSQIKLANIFKKENLDSTLFEIVNTEENIATIVSAQLSNENSQLIVNAEDASKRDQFWVKDLSSDKEANLIIEKFNADFEYLASNGSKLYFLTNLSASKNRIISIDLKSPERRNWKEVIGQNNHLLINAIKVNNQWLLLYKENSRSKLYIASLNGQNLKAFDTPNSSDYELIDIVHDALFEQNNNPLIIESNLLNTNQVLKLNLASHSPSVILNNNPELQSTDFKLDSQVHFFRSNDGSRVPITLLSKDKIKRNSPTLMLANDGNGTLFENEYDPIISNFIQSGGLVAIIHTRGGSTYGNNWYHSATGKNRIKIVEDIIAGQNWLFDKSYTQKDNLAVYASKDNASSFALYLTKPESSLKAVIFNHGNFDLFTKAKSLNKAAELNEATEDNWIEKFSYSPTEKNTEILKAFNPLSNVSIKQYPATLIISNQNQRDSLKYLAKLQNHQTSDQAILWLNDSDSEQYYKILYFLEDQLQF